MKLPHIALSGLILLGLMGCTDNSKQNAAAPLYVSTTTVGKPIETQLRTFRGVVVPAELTPLGFRLEGEISQLVVKTGDLVKKGQLLARLENSKQTQNLNDAKATLTLTTKQLNRAKELLDRKMLSKAEYDELVANQRLAQAKHNLAKNQLNYTSLYAPFTGKVSDVFKERFEPTDEGETVLTLYQHDKVYVRIELSDNLLAMINPMQSAQMRQYQPEVSFTGVEGEYQMRFLEYSTEPNEQTKNYQLFLAMTQPRHEILPGTSATVSVDMSKAGISSVYGYSIPLTALQSGDEKGAFFVWKHLDSKATKVPVKVADINSDGAVISSGIKKGDKLINSSLRKLREGAVVHVLENE